MNASDWLEFWLSNAFRVSILVLCVITLRTLTAKRSAQPLITVEELPGKQFVVRCSQHGTLGVADGDREVGRLVFAHFVDLHEVPR